MTKKQYLAALKTLNLPIIGAMKLGMSKRQSQRLAAGSPIPKPLALLMLVMIAKGISPDDLKDFKP